jgi:hypothetical protein
MSTRKKRTKRNANKIKNNPKKVKKQLFLVSKIPHSPLKSKRRRLVKLSERSECNPDNNTKNLSESISILQNKKVSEIKSNADKCSDNSNSQINQKIASSLYPPTIVDEQIKYFQLQNHQIREESMRQNIMSVSFITSEELQNFNDNNFSLNNNIYSDILAFNQLYNKLFYPRSIDTHYYNYVRSFPLSKCCDNMFSSFTGYTTNNLVDNSHYPYDYDFRCNYGFPYNSKNKFLKRKRNYHNKRDFNIRRRWNTRSINENRSDKINYLLPDYT